MAVLISPIYELMIKIIGFFNGLHLFYQTQIKIILALELTIFMF